MKRILSIAPVLAATLLGACGGGGGGTGGGGAAVNRAPAISGSPGTTVNAGTAYSFQPAASDPDGDTLTFSVQGKPAWLQFDTATGALSGTPAASHVGTHSGIAITASDGRTTTTLPSFSITVVDAGALQISGTPPPRTTVAQTYSFTPLASQQESDAEEPQGNELGFSVRNLPKWARFDKLLGQLYGTPTVSDVGTYSEIRISVTDSTRIVSLPDFSITVEPQSNGQATVSWQAPTENTDGSPLTDLGGYVIFFGQTPRDMVQARTVNGIGTTSLVISNLAEGTWYFQMLAYNIDNAESPRTPLVSKTVR